MNQESFPINEPAISTKPSKALNILTILSIIANSFGILSSVMQYFRAQSDYDSLKIALESGGMEKLPSFLKGFINKDGLLVAEKMLENRVPIMITGIIASILCLYGAIEMRKLKLQGYTFWLIGELLPVVSLAVFVGSIAFNGYLLLGYLFTLLFIILYTVHKKELVK